MKTSGQILEVCGIKFLNVPHTPAVLDEVLIQDCYNINEIPDGCVVVDVGAFYGEFGLLCSAAKGCPVFGFEPSKTNHSIAQFNTYLNCGRTSTKHINIKHAAIGSRNGTATFFHREDHPAGSSLSEMPESIPETVQVLRLSRVVESILSKLGDRRRICIKMDCEGSERDIFDNDPGWMDQVKIVTMEWHNHDGDYYGGLLEQRGFKVHLEGGGPKPRPKWDKSIGGGMLFATKL